MKKENSDDVHNSGVYSLAEENDFLVVGELFADLAEKGAYTIEKGEAILKAYEDSLLEESKQSGGYSRKTE